MRSYEAARGLFSLLGFLAWCAIIGGGIFALMAGGAAAEMRSFGGPPTALAITLATAPGLGISTMGLYGLAIVQNGRATVDTAELTQQMLKVARDQLQVSQQALKQTDLAQRTYAAAPSEKDTRSSPGYTVDPAAHELPAEQPDRIEQKIGKGPVDGTPKMTRPETIFQDGKQLTYRGNIIEVVEGKFTYNGIPFDTLKKAHSYIDQFGTSS